QYSSAKAVQRIAFFIKGPPIFLPIRNAGLACSVPCPTQRYSGCRCDCSRELVLPVRIELTTSPLPRECRALKNQSVVSDYCCFPRIFRGSVIGGRRLARCASTLAIA